MNLDPETRRSLRYLFGLLGVVSFIALVVGCLVGGFLVGVVYG